MQSAPFQSASLYVGDLHDSVMEGKLFELFNRVGPVASIRVCRDTVTRQSLGYAYVNFHNVQDAERALDTMNFTEINGIPCRIMWSQRDPSLRKSGVGNVFVKNLPPNVDNKGLFDTFSVFGNILSCKVATHATTDPVTGQYVVTSKGYGYVHYETADAAQDAIQKFNGMMIEDATVSVCNFVKSALRPQPARWTNVYVKQFPISWRENDLIKLFERFGECGSVQIVIDPATGQSKGVGYYDFKHHESAAQAVQELNEFLIKYDDGTEYVLYVSQHQKRTDRLRELQRRSEEQKNEKISKFQGMNLYVKHLSDEITDDELREAFGQFGTITSARIMRMGEGPGAPSKGFGYVCFSTVEEAQRALTEMSNKQLPRSPKPLYVAIHQRHDQRRAALEQYHGGRGMRYGGAGPGMQMAPFFMGPPQFGGRAYPYQGGGGFGGRGGGRPPTQGGFQGRNFVQQPSFFQPYPQPNRRYQGQQGAMLQGGMQMRRPQQRPAGRGYGGFPQQQGIVPQRQPARAPVFNRDARVPQMSPMAGLQPAAELMPLQEMGGESLSPELLARADAQQQKNMIGERLYPLIYTHQPQLAGKITGMLLEMDNAELLNLIESTDALRHKIDEALIVLKNHQQGEIQADAE